MTVSKVARVALVVVTVALSASLLAASGTGSTARSWAWEAGMPGEPVAGASGRRLLVAAGDFGLLAAVGDGTVEVGVTAGSEAGFRPLVELAGEDPLVVFAAATPEGGSQRLVGVARSDVDGVEAVLRDGTTRELPLNEWRAFSYTAAASSEAAMGLVARSSGSEVGVVRVPQTTTTMPAREEQRYALFERADGTQLARIDPRTLAPVGRALVLPGYRYGPARSPDGTKLAIAASDRAVVELIDLDRLERQAAIPLAAGERTLVRALAWLRGDRLAAVVQRMSVPTGRYVRSRELVVVDPQARRVVARTAITNKLAMHGFGSAGGRLVVLLRPQAPRKSSAVQLVVADADGTARTTDVEVGRHGSALRQSVLVVEPSGRRALVLVWAFGLSEGRAVEVELDTMRPVTRTIRLAAGTRIRPAGVSSLQAVAAGDNHVVATDIVPGSDGRIAAGVFLLDTRTWIARLLDPRARGLAYHDGRVYTFGFDNLSGRGNLLPRGGIGVSAYDLEGRRVYHAYGERNFARLLFTGRYGHGLAQAPGTQVVFDAAGGQGIGKRAPLHPYRIELVPEADPVATRSVSGQGAAPYRFSTQGRPVALRPDSTRLFNGHRVSARLLATEGGRAFYRLRPTPDVECYATGKASRLGDIGSMACQGEPGGRPLVEFGHVTAKPGDEPHAVSLEGFAADEVATVIAVDRRGTRLAEVAPHKNIYVFRPVPPTVRTVIALDANGDPLSQRAVPRVTFPPALFGPRIGRVSPSAIKPPIRTGTDRGVEISAGGNGVAVFRTGEADPAAARALRGHASYGCLRLAPNSWDTDSGGLLWRTYEPVVAVRITGLPRPFDGCQIQASYGHRWPDRFDSHSVVEVAFNERARRYFQDRAAARDLALFVRSGEMQRLRRKTGSVLWSVVRSRYGDAVVLLGRASDKPPVGKIGIWALGERTIFSEQSPTGARLFVEVRNGRIVAHNLRQLAKAF